MNKHFIYIGKDKTFLDFGFISAKNKNSARNIYLKNGVCKNVLILNKQEIKRLTKYLNDNFVKGMLK